MSTRRDPALQDALRLSRALINAEVGRYSSRLHEASESEIHRRFAATSITGEEFDHKVAFETSDKAFSIYRAGELPPPPDPEDVDASSAP